MRIVMMGTGPFAVPTLLDLHDSAHDVRAVIARPARQVRTRGKAPPQPMRDAARGVGLEVFDPEDINGDEGQALLNRLSPDLLVVCDYGQILSREVLGMARFGGINLHGSLLPKYRGAAPVVRAVQEGETTTGVTVIHMTPRLDGGPMLVKRETAIDPDETALELEPRLAQLGVPVVREAIEILSTWDGGTTIGEMQDPGMVTKAPRLNKAEGEVDWTQSASRIRNQIRAFKPWPKTFTQWLDAPHGPLRLILDEATVLENEDGCNKEPHQPGTVIFADQKETQIATGQGVLQLNRVQPAGKKPMSIAEFLHGHPVQTGHRFGRDEK